MALCRPQRGSAPSLAGPAGPGPVAHADPAVPLRQLPAAPAGQQLCVHPDAAGRPLGHKDTVSFWRARAPAGLALLSLGSTSGAFCPPVSRQAPHPSQHEAFACGLCGGCLVPGGQGWWSWGNSAPSLFSVHSFPDTIRRCSQAARLVLVYLLAAGSGCHSEGSRVIPENLLELLLV